MKMPKDRFEWIKAMIADSVELWGHNKCVDYSETISPMRSRWDLFYAASRHYDGFRISDLYVDGINDTHIDTVLRRVVKELDLTIRKVG